LLDFVADEQYLLEQTSIGDSMKRTFELLASAAALALLLFSSNISAKESAASQTIASRTAAVGGVKLHYLAAGHGPAVILLSCCTAIRRLRACGDRLFRPSPGNFP